MRVGRGELAESVVADALRDPATPRPEISSRAFVAPAHGLWLERVDFEMCLELLPDLQAQMRKMAQKRLAELDLSNCVSAEVLQQFVDL